MSNALNQLENLQGWPKKFACNRCNQEMDSQPGDWERNRFVQDLNHPHAWIPKTRNCPDCFEKAKIESERLRIEQEEKAKTDLQQAPLKRAQNIPHLMRSIFPKKFASVEYELPEMFEPWIVTPEKGLCLTGKPGVGKTMFMAMIVREYLHRSALDEKKWGYDTWDHPSILSLWEFISYPEFIMELQDSYKRSADEETPLKMLEGIANKPYLIIDDLGAEKPTDYVRQATYYLINHREMNCLPTFITTNFSLDFLDEKIDSRIASRICGMCDIKQIIAEDRRKPKK